MRAKEKKNLNHNQTTDNKEVSDITLEELQKLIIEKPNDAGLYLTRAELLFRMNNLGKASNDYRKVIELEPDNKEAAGKIEFINTILRYQNTDIYANPNTNLDPWLE